jgi:uncharacterized repeat protein (TIGR03803 family)
MHKYFIAISTTALLLFGCSNAHSAVPQPLGSIQAGQKNSGGTFASPENTYSVLYEFQSGADGAGPLGDLIQDSAGNLYGTTQLGGSKNDGVAFKIDPNGNESTLHSFNGTGGEWPLAGLVRNAAGDVYGTTAYGGSFHRGVVFKLDPSGHETVLHNFSGTDGNGPNGDLTLDSAGNIYGTTSAGGTKNLGVIFKLDSSGNETVLYNFRSPGGAAPNGGLVRDAAGNLFGTTSEGGQGCNRMGCGVVFKLDPNGGETVLHLFIGTDGATPTAPLLPDAAGNLYGTTSAGGAGAHGVVFKIDPNGNETTLHRFNGRDGDAPTGALIWGGASGNALYGITSYGGGGGCRLGCGVVFKLVPSGKLSVLHAFSAVGGEQPYSGMVRDSAGNLYGTTYYGGSSACLAGCGVVFKLTQ